MPSECMYGRGFIAGHVDGSNSEGLGVIEGGL